MTRNAGVEIVNANELFSQLVQAEGGPCVLDRAYLLYHGRSAGPAAKFGLGGELFLDHPDRSMLRQQAATFLADYWQRFPAAVHQFLPNHARKTKGFKVNPLALIEKDIAGSDVETPYSGALFGPVDVGLPNDDIAPHQARTLIVEPDSEESSFIRVAMPLCDPNGSSPNSTPQFDTLLSAFLDWCSLFKPRHGSAGFTLIVSPGMEQNSVQCLQLMKRFPGLDFPDPVRFIGETEGVRNRIKCVNWLTVLGDPLVEELGGLAALRSSLTPACTVHLYDGGILIQAGETPRLGDTEKGDIPEEYQRVARATQPVRFEDYPSALFRVAPGLDKKKETLAWIRRFD
ncbi:Protein of unknown function [Roseateles sp. YR242]|nr:Protein of unknown function [Roseateles sp. YR242]